MWSAGPAKVAVWCLVMGRGYRKQTRVRWNPWVRQHVFPTVRKHCQHSTLNLANRLTVLHYFISYDLFFFCYFAVGRDLWGYSQKRLKWPACRGTGKDKNISFSLPAIISWKSGCIQPTQFSEVAQMSQLVVDHTWVFPGFILSSLVF